MNGRTQTIPEPGAFQPVLPLDGCAATHPDDTKAHLEMEDELAREVIEQARNTDRAKVRLQELDLERCRAREFRRGWGPREEPEKLMLRDIACIARDEVDIEPVRRRMTEAQEDAVGRRGAAVSRRYPAPVRGNWGGARDHGGRCASCGRIVVKIINQLGDEVMMMFRV